MKYEEDNNIYSSSGRDISSRSRTYEDISSRSERVQSEPRREASSGGRTGGKKRKKHRLRNALLVLICLLLVCGGGFYAYVYRMLDKIERDPLDQEDLGITTHDYDGYRNIALLGLDSRTDSTSGRSDAIVILSIDKSHKKIRLISIARDTYVAIDGHGHDKLTHAYAYGKSQLAVKTLNQNFGLEITDYVTMNFFELSRVIDYIGGVTIEISAEEMKELNNVIIPQMNKLGITCEPIPNAGKQLLSGGQAVGYARIRHTDSDVQRGNRQKEVLVAMFDQVKKTSVLKLPYVAEMVASQCRTSLSTNDIISLGTWAMQASPTFEQLSVPNENIPSSGKIINGRWYYVYDLEIARQNIRDFIYGNQPEQAAP